MSSGAPSPDPHPAMAAPESRADWARTSLGELRRLDPRQASAVFQVYVRRLSCADAARALDLTHEEFSRALADGMRSLGRRLGSA